MLALLGCAAKSLGLDKASVEFLDNAHAVSQPLTACPVSTSVPRAKATVSPF
jgi:hypothetical protein